MNRQNITETYTDNHTWVEFKSEKSAIFYESSSYYEYHAHWEFDDDFKIPYLDYSVTSRLYWSQDYEILKLRNKELWMTSTLGSVTIRVELSEY